MKFEYSFELCVRDGHQCLKQTLVAVMVISASSRPLVHTPIIARLHALAFSLTRPPAAQWFKEQKKRWCSLLGGWSTRPSLMGGSGWALLDAGGGPCTPLAFTLQSVRAWLNSNPAALKSGWDKFVPSVCTAARWRLMCSTPWVFQNKKKSC